MKVLATKYPLVLKDNLMGADPFKGQPHNIQPYYEQGVRQTPHHIKREALSYIKKLIDEKIIEPQCQVTS